MDNTKLKVGCVVGVGVGVLASSLVIGTEMSTYSSIIFESINSENPYEIIQKNNTVDYVKNNSQISFRKDLIKTDEDTYDDEFPEIELVEIPVVKRMVFQFKKPAKLEFS